MPFRILIERNGRRALSEDKETGVGVYQDVRPVSQLGTHPHFINLKFLHLISYIRKRMEAICKKFNLNCNDSHGALKILCL